jgi:hypothetical protein
MMIENLSDQDFGLHVENRAESGYKHLLVSVFFLGVLE